MFYSYKNIKIHYQVIGSGKPIFMIHGLDCDLNLMKGCFEPIFKNKNGYKRIYIDLPGMGKSEALLEYASSDKILDILISFAENIISENFLLIGESYGGYLSRGILSKLNSKIEGMALLCPVVIPIHAKRDVPKNIIKFEDKDFTNTLNDFERKTFGKFSVLENKKVYKRYKNEILSGIKKCNKDFIESLWKNYSFSFNVDKKLKKIKFDKPVLFMAGRQDICVGYKDLYKLLEDYPRATFSVIDIAGHNLQIEQPELFNSLVENFLIRAKNNINKF
jgi:pimeloyl-ACP methyl ester carboxylesterase